MTLTPGEDGTWVIGTNKGEHYTKTVVICAGVGAFAPTKLGVPGTEKYEGNGLYYFVKEKAAFAGKDLLIVGGGDFGGRLGDKPQRRGQVNYPCAPPRRVQGAREHGKRDAQPAGAGS